MLIFAVNMCLINVIWGEISKLGVRKVVRHLMVVLGSDMIFLSYILLATFSIIKLLYATFIGFWATFVVQLL